jgi:hypothetical protein
MLVFSRMRCISPVFVPLDMVSPKFQAQGLESIRTSQSNSNPMDGEAGFSKNLTIFEPHNTNADAH